MIVLRRPIGVHSLLEDYMFKNVRSIWDTWNLNWYIGSFIFSLISVLLFPFWIYMIAMDFWEWFKFHAANQEKKRIQESEYYKLKSMAGNFSKNRWFSYRDYIETIVRDKDNNLIIVFKLNNDATITRRLSEEKFIEEYGYRNSLDMLRQFRIPRITSYPYTSQDLFASWLP